MRIWKEEVFGPVMVIVKCGSDDEAVRLANDCPFGLGSAVFSRSAARARSIGARLEVSLIMCISVQRIGTCCSLAASVP